MIHFPACCIPALAPWLGLVPRLRDLGASVVKDPGNKEAKP